MYIIHIYIYKQNITFQTRFYIQKQVFLLLLLLCKTIKIIRFDIDARDNE